MLASDYPAMHTCFLHRCTCTNRWRVTRRAGIMLIYEYSCNHAHHRAPYRSSWGLLRDADVSSWRNSDGRCVRRMLYLGVVYITLNLLGVRSTLGTSLMYARYLIPRPREKYIVDTGTSFDRYDAQLFNDATHFPIMPTCQTCDCHPSSTARLSVMLLIIAGDTIAAPYQHSLALNLPLQ